MRVKIHKSITEERVINAIEMDDNSGFCFHCGEDAYGCEPDAEQYECENCGRNAVYGAEMTLFYLPGEIK